MNNIYSPSITQTNETSYKTINYPNINKTSMMMSQNELNIEKKHKTPIQKLIFQLNNYRCTMNNKKDFFLDEDDIKNNENFKIFMDNLLNKEDSIDNFGNSNFSNNDNENSSIRSNNKFFLKKIDRINNNTNNNISNNIKEEDSYYSFFHNNLNNKSSTKIIKDAFQFQYRLKNYLSSIKGYNNINNNNTDLERNKNYLNYEKNFLSSFEKEYKNIGINCKINRKRNPIFFRKNKNDDITQFAQTFSLKEFDGRMLNKLEQNEIVEKIPKKKKNKSNSFNKIKKYLRDYKIPKIIFFSRNNNMKDKKNEEKKLNTMKENALHFLKDKTRYSLTSKNFINLNINEKNGLSINKDKDIDNNKKYFKQVFSPINKYKKYDKTEKNLMPYIKNYEKKILKNKYMNLKNKKLFYSSIKNRDSTNHNIKYITINNIKQ